VDPKRDIGFVNSELMLNDLVFIEKRLERLDKGAKKGAEETAVKDKELLERLKSHLERELPLRLADLTPDDRKTISSYPFLTRKGMIIALNVSEDLVKDSTLLKHLEADYEKSKIQVMQVSAKVEAEIAALESEEERREFLKTIGVEEPAINALTRACIKALDLVSFFTVGPDEIRQWTIRRGSSAPEAAGAIHSDLQRGFIRAEVMKFADLSSLGSEEKVKEAGKLYIKGKDYIVEDGDILTIRFNV
jgi:GTP-binding protein YchF